MTMTAIRKEFDSRRRFDSFCGGGLTEYYNSIQKTIEDLWKNGYTDDFSNDFLALANGYQINSGDYDEFHVNCCLDLRSITATKRAVKRFAEFFLG